MDKSIEVFILTHKRTILLIMVGGVILWYLIFPAIYMDESITPPLADMDKSEITEAWLLDVSIQNESSIILSCEEVYSMTKICERIPFRISPRYQETILFTQYASASHGESIHQVIRAYYPVIDIYVDFHSTDQVSKRIIEIASNLSGEGAVVECIVYTEPVEVTVSEYLIYLNHTENVSSEDVEWKFIRTVSFEDDNYGLYPESGRGSVRDWSGYDFDLDFSVPRHDYLEYMIFTEIMHYETMLNNKYNFNVWWYSDELSVEIR